MSFLNISSKEHIILLGILFFQTYCLVQLALSLDTCHFSAYCYLGISRHVLFHLWTWPLILPDPFILGVMALILLLFDMHLDYVYLPSCKD